MQWSKLKKRVEALFSDKVIGRVGLYTTSYSKDGYMGRAWITIDGKEIFNFLGEGPWYRKLLEKEFDSEVFEPIGPEYSNCKNFKEYEEQFDAHLNSDEYQNYLIEIDEKENELYNENIFERADLTIAMNDYLNLSIDEILKSESIFIKALGMLDRRVGKRRLKSMNIEKEHSLVQKLYQFRVECEGISHASKA